MSALTDFLKVEGVNQRKIYEESVAEVERWRDSVNRLLEAMYDMLQKADEGKVLKVEMRSHQLREEGVGAYPIHSLSIVLGTRSVDILPIARKVMAIFDEGQAPARKAQGRVDMTNGLEKYLLLRFVTPEGEVWMIVDAQTYGMKPLDRDSFEEAVLRLLK